MANANVSDNKKLVPIHCELLCFLQDKCKVLPFDGLVDICTSFYKWSDVSQAKSLISEHCQQRFVKHKGSDAEKVKKTLIDMLRVILDPAITLPTYYAIQLARLPPVGIEHVDISALFQEVVNLRAEVRSMASLRSDIQDVRALIRRNAQPTAMQGVLLSTEQGAGSLASTATENNSAEVGDTSSPTSGSTYADAARRASREAMDSHHEQRIRGLRASRKPVIGKAQGKKLRSAPAKKVIELFVTRLDPDTKVEEVEENVMEVISSDDGLSADIINVKCTKLETKFPEYSSFRVSVALNAASQQRAIDILMSGDVWPIGAFVRRFFVPKDK